MADPLDMSDDELIDALANWTFFGGGSTAKLIDAAKIRLKLKMLQIEALKKTPEGNTRP